MLFIMIKQAFNHYITHHVDPAMDMIGEGDYWRAIKKRVKSFFEIMTAKDTA